MRWCRAEPGRRRLGLAMAHLDEAHCGVPFFMMGGAYVSPGTASMRTGPQAERLGSGGRLERVIGGGRGGRRRAHRPDGMVGADQVHGVDRGLDAAQSLIRLRSPEAAHV